MVPSPAPHRCDLDASPTPEARRQRSVLAKLISAIEPDKGEFLAQALLAEFRSISRIWAQSPESLGRILGPASPVVAIILGARDAALESMSGDLRGISIDPFSPQLGRYLIASMGSLADETLRILFLDNARRLIADERLQHGTLGQLALFPRTIFRRALEHNAAGIILAHNHPSGDPSPSEEDVSATRHLVEIGRSLDIKVVNHIIVTAAYAHPVISRDSTSGRAPASSSVTLRAREPPVGGLGIALENAKAAMHRRLLRQQLIGSPELFGDPAWEMLVDLFIHHCEGKDLSISSLRVTPRISMSSALRLAQKLCDAGILRRVADPFDGRRSIIKLEPVIAHRIRAYFEEGIE